VLVNSDVCISGYSSHCLIRRRIVSFSGPAMPERLRHELGARSGAPTVRPGVATTGTDGMIPMSNAVSNIADACLNVDDPAAPYAARADRTIAGAAPASTAPETREQLQENAHQVVRSRGGRCPGVYFKVHSPTHTKHTDMTDEAPGPYSTVRYRTRCSALSTASGARAHGYRKAKPARLDVKHCARR
jgi:hypothetical protein